MAALERIVIGFDTSLRSTGVGVVQVLGSVRKALHFAPIRVPQSRLMSQALQMIDEEALGYLSPHRGCVRNGLLCQKCSHGDDFVPCAWRGGDELR